MTAQATVPLEKAKRLEPAKASIREALGIAYFRLAPLARGRARVPRDRSSCRRPTTTRTTRSAARSRSWAATAEANGHYKLASSMKPSSETYSSRILDLE